MLSLVDVPRRERERERGKKQMKANSTIIGRSTTRG